MKRKNAKIKIVSIDKETSFNIVNVFFLFFMFALLAYCTSCAKIESKKMSLENALNTQAANAAATDQNRR